jgi:hypothetical protein
MTKRSRMYWIAFGVAVIVALAALRHDRKHVKLDADPHSIKRSTD